MLLNTPYCNILNNGLEVNELFHILTEIYLTLFGINCSYITQDDVSCSKLTLS